jgi:hypothetical protein
LQTKDKDGIVMNIPTLDYVRWVAQDETVLGFLVKNMAKEVLMQMVGLRTYDVVWKVVVEMFSALL